MCKYLILIIYQVLVRRSPSPGIYRDESRRLRKSGLDDTYLTRKKLDMNMKWSNLTSNLIRIVEMDQIRLQIWYLKFDKSKFDFIRTSSSKLSRLVPIFLCRNDNHEIVIKKSIDIKIDERKIHLLFCTSNI